MTLDPKLSGLLLIVVAIIAIVALALVVVLMTRVGRMKRQYRVLSAADSRSSFIEVVADKVEEVKLLRGDVARLSTELRATQGDLSRSLRHIYVNRFDAFGDMGGQISFAVAAVDDHGNGFVLTTIHARSESRSYIKALHGGMSDLPMSPEETEAVTQVMREIPRS